MPAKHCMHLRQAYDRNFFISIGRISQYFGHSVRPSPQVDFYSIFSITPHLWCQRSYRTNTSVPEKGSDVALPKSQSTASGLSEETMSMFLRVMSRCIMPMLCKDSMPSRVSFNSRILFLISMEVQIGGVKFLTQNGKHIKTFSGKMPHGLELPCSQKDDSAGRSPLRF